MATPDLSKLTIDRSKQAHVPGQRAPRRRWLRIAAFAALAIVVAAVSRTLAGKPSVDVGSVVLVYPAQNYTLLNATGYAVAQRKAAISSKATGRLEWLGVLEGSHVKKDELIARLENRDVAASLGQAQAGVKQAQANLELAHAELFDAERAYQRSTELLAQHFIAPSANDTALARRDKARAGVSA
ncbi:MAG: biotin/lipoyl-binding protein, partial [Pseudomonadota bacterium]|nr:biotin/lipoyl-binding protein [Pseudomonadota bacterium]